MKINLSKNQKITIGIILLILLALLLWWLFSRGGESQTEYAIEHEYIAGSSTGYRLQVEFDPLPASPLMGATGTGIVKVIDDNDNPVRDVQGYVAIYLEEYARNAGGSNTTSLGTGEGNWPTETGVDFHTGYLVGNTVINDEDATTFIERGIKGGQFGNLKKTLVDDGSHELIERTDGNLQYFELKDGSARFEYLRGYHGATPPVVTISTLESPMWPELPSEYEDSAKLEFVPQIVENRTTGLVEDVVSDEPEDDKQLRRSQVTGYFLKPINFQNYVHYEGADLIKTYATIPVGEPDDYDYGNPPSSHFSAADYYYEISPVTNLKSISSRTDTFEIEIQAKAMPGKTLPEDINDTITLKLQNDQPSQRISYPLRFADSNSNELRDRFKGIFSNTSRDGGSNNEISFETDARPTIITVETAQLNNIIGNANIMLIAKQNRSLDDVITRRCSDSRVEALEFPDKGAVPIECLNVFTYTFWGLPIR